MDLLPKGTSEDRQQVLSFQRDISKRKKTLQRTVGVQMKRKGSYSNLSGNSELLLCPQRVISFVTIVSNDFYKFKYRKKRSENLRSLYSHDNGYPNISHQSYDILSILYSARKNSIKPQLKNVAQKMKLFGRQDGSEYNFLWRMNFQYVTSSLHKYPNFHTLGILNLKGFKNFQINNHK